MPRETGHRKHLARTYALLARHDLFKFAQTPQSIHKDNNKGGSMDIDQEGSVLNGKTAPGGQVVLPGTALP